MAYLRPPKLKNQETLNDRNITGHLNLFSGQDVGAMLT